MRILYLPNYTAHDVLASSDFRHPLKLLESLLALDDSLYALFVVPKAIPRSALPTIPRIHWVAYDQGSYSFQDEQKEVQGNFIEFFNERIGNFVVDLVLTTRAMYAGYYALMAMDGRAKLPSVPVVVWEMFPIASGHMVGTSDLALMARAMGYAWGHLFTDSQEEIEAAVRIAGRYLSGVYAEQVRKRAILITSAPNVSDLKTVVKDVPKPVPTESFNLLHAGRLNANKGIDGILGLYDHFRASGTPGRITVCTADNNSDKIAAAHRRCPSAEIHVGLPRAQYYAKLAEHHAFVVNSIADGVPHAWVEQIAARVVPLFPAHRPYTQSILGELRDCYPFVYKDHDEAYAMLHWIREHWEEADRAREQVERRLTGQMSSDQSAARLLAYFYDFVAEDEEHYASKLGAGERSVWRKPLEQALAIMPEWFTLNDFVEVFARATRSVHAGQVANPYFRGVPSRFSLYKFLAGHPDTVREEAARPYPTYRRVA